MIKFEVYLLLCRDDKYSAEAVKSFNDSYSQIGVEKFVSVKSSDYKYFLEKHSQYKDFKFVINNSTNVYEHMKKISSKSKSDYIMFLHDDDLFGKNLLVKTFSILEKNSPNALSVRPTFINFESKVYKRFQFKYSSKIYNKIETLSLASYFLPFLKPIVFPTIAYKNNLFRNYFQQNKFGMGIHEDVRIVTYFLSKGNFLEHKMTDLYFYRHHDYQSSNFKSKEGSRLQLIKWLKTYNINFFFKQFLIILSYIQFFIFVKEFKSSKNLFLFIFLNLRRKLILFGRGGKGINDQN